MASLWMGSLGSELQLAPTADTQGLPDFTILHPATTAGRPRRTRLFRLGWLWLLVQLISAQPLPLLRQLIPEPWPEVPQEWNTFLTHQEALSHVSA